MANKSSPRIAAVIPARMGSSRFPGKPLAKLLGLPMVQHVYARVAMSKALSGTYLATCDDEIATVTRIFGGRYVMTSTKHQRASDRVAEAAEKIDADIFVLVQGDEPMVTPEMVDASVAPMLTDASIQCVNLTKRITTTEEMEDPNTIKVVMDKNWDALYFSREPIPTRRVRAFKDIPIYKQVCIIPFRKEALLKYAALPPTPLEVAESVDMMRFLEHGIKVRMVETRQDTHAVDTPADLAMVERLMKSDPLVRRYSNS
jgi:3-deoxy-manno-octulosonate cytidylyltransferase (CMP-KDO synthetase)